MYMHTSLHALLGISRPPSLVDDAVGTFIFIVLDLGRKKKDANGAYNASLSRPTRHPELQRHADTTIYLLCEGYNRC